jgi:cob(I)alamin adenosyltransferase
MDLQPAVFTQRSPRAIARSIKRSAERSTRRKAGAYQSSMSMLTFYLNRAGKKLTGARRATLERAKDELRKLFGKR